MGVFLGWEEVKIDRSGRGWKLFFIAFRKQ